MMSESRTAIEDCIDAYDKGDFDFFLSFANLRSPDEDDKKYAALLGDVARRIRDPEKAKVSCSHHELHGLFSYACGTPMPAKNNFIKKLEHKGVTLVTIHHEHGGRPKGWSVKPKVYDELLAAIQAKKPVKLVNEYTKR
jgi:hypothetical protein